MELHNNKQAESFDQTGTLFRSSACPRMAITTIRLADSFTVKNTLYQPST
jgi:hypothetical protein